LTGIIPRPEMRAQYEWADVFLLPSLCEGSATVTYEALFRGRPVICTPQTGSTIRDGVDGFVVPARDPGAIVDKLELLASKTGLLATMSENACQTSRENTLAKYGERLLGCFKERLITS
jgi:glycosyltransferase involved in cell wall biosynthesis